MLPLKSFFLTYSFNYYTITLEFNSNNILKINIVRLFSAGVIFYQTENFRVKQNKAQNLIINPKRRKNAL